MRTWMVAGATTLVLIVGGQAAEARAGRGFGRLFSGRVYATPRPTAQTLSREARVEPRAGMLGYRPTLVVSPGRIASATAAGAVLPALAAETPAIAKPVGQPARAEPPKPRVQEARAPRPPCAPERMVGRVESDGDGFCLIN